MKPTLEQEAILKAVRETKSSLMINAGAGCGKTTTLEMIARAIPPEQPALAVAFNVSTKKNMEKRFPDNFRVKTLNGLGHSAWGKAIGKRLGVEENKLGAIVKNVFKDAQFSGTAEQFAGVCKLVSSAMHAGLIPQRYAKNYKGLVEDREEVWQDIADEHFIDVGSSLIGFARETLTISIQQAFAGTINYDDQIYMSALFGGVFPRFPLVLVDEAQDLSPLNHIQVRRCAADRLMVVGDQKQSIYAFRGADHESIEKLRSLRSDWIDLPLMLTFRCPKVIVERQQEHVPGFRAHESNAEGLYKNLLVTEKKDWSWETIQELKHRPDAEVAILCRNNAPLLSTAFRLIKQRVGCHMLGRDIGKNLIALSRKIMPLDDIPAEDCFRLINEWRKKEISLAVANEKEHKISGITDRADCLVAVIESGEVETAGKLRQALDDLFARTHGQVTLSTGHRAKGLEWDIIIHIDPWFIPSKQAQRAASQGNSAQLKQELNLKYVIETRSKHTLILANSEDFANV